MSYTRADCDDLLRIYLQDIGRYSLLSRDEEVLLAQQIEAGVIADQRLGDDGAAESRLSDLEQVAARGLRARESFVRANLRLVVSVAKQYSGSGVPLVDLIQEGNLGLMHAVEKFDWRLGFRFSTYATWWIRQSISRGIAMTRRTVRLPVHAHEALARVRAKRFDLQVALGRPPTVNELAAAVDLPVGNVERLLHFDAEDLSLFNTLDANTDQSYADVVEDRSVESPCEAAIRALLVGDVEQLLSRLLPREALVLRLRFGLDGAVERTLQQIADRLGVTRERVRQIEARAIEKLRESYGKQVGELLAS
jgi:RNA polymerase sigma factor (sigma-70 family)